MCEIWTQCVYCDVDTTFVCSVYMKFGLQLFNLFILQRGVTGGAHIAKTLHVVE